jgi:hypothetical protein
MTKKNKITKITKLPEVPKLPEPPKQIGGFHGFMSYVHTHVDYLNSNKFFAGIVMLTLNIGSRFVTIDLSKSTEQYLKYSVTRQILIFAICWMGTRDIYISLGLTAVFVILADHLFNHDSRFCIVPSSYKKIEKAMDTNNDGVISADELSSAIAILEKAKKEKQQQSQAVKM